MRISLLDKWRMLQAIFADTRLSQSAKVVAGVLLDFLNTETLQCNPAIETIEAGCGKLKRRQVTAALTLLKDAGWLEQKRRRGTSAFSFTLDRVDAQFSAHQQPEDARETAHLRADSAHVAS